MRFLGLPLALAASLSASIALAPSTARAQEPLVPDPPAQVFVHLDGARGAELQHEQTDGSWVTVCADACDRAVPLEGRYRIDGDNVRTSDPFVLEGGAPGDRL